MTKDKAMDALLEAIKAEEQEVIKYDAQMRLEGFIVRVTAWIHPEEGGSDYQQDWYFKVIPTNQKIRRLIRKEGSCINHDFIIESL